MNVSLVVARSLAWLCLVGVLQWSSLIVGLYLLPPSEAEETPNSTPVNDAVITGAVLGSGYSLVCSPPAPVAAAPVAVTGVVPAVAGGSAVPSASGSSASFTFCTFVKIHKSRLRSPLFMYDGATWTAILDVTRLGVALQVQETNSDKVLRYFFEVRFPPNVWRYLCLQYDHLTHQVACIVDDTSEPLSAQHLPWSEFEETVVGETEEMSRPFGNKDLDGNTTGKSANGYNSVPNSVKPGVGNDQIRRLLMTRTMCVGGGHRGILEAEVAQAALWRRTLGVDMLLKASGCRGHEVVVTPYLLLGPQWMVEGNASLGSFSLDEVCHVVQWAVIVQPARSYSNHMMVCRYLGGTLMASDDLTSHVMTLARGTNDSCVGPRGLLTWLLGGKMGKGATVRVTAEDECPAQSTDGGTFVACVRQLECSLCQVPSTAMYNLYGHDGRIFDYNFYIYAASGELAFKGTGGSEIVRVGGGWVLKSTLHQMEWVLAEAAVPVGRQKWVVGDDKMVLAFTTCRTSQFTCDNGQCVPQISRCDDIAHCLDRSDEANCHVVERSSGYDPYYPPPPRPGEEIPMDLFYRVDLYSMDDMTTESGLATMNVGMTLSWFDSRLKFVNLKPKVKNYFPCELVWTPSVRAVSGHGEGTVLETTNYEKFCYAYADETTKRPLDDPYMSHQADGMTHALQHYVGVLASVPCHFQLQMYPFDFQLCNISFMLMNAPWTRVFKKSQEGDRVPYYDSRRVLLEYELEDQTTEVGWFLQGTDNNTYFVLTFHLRRLYGYHVVNSFFPSLLMFFVSFATLFFQLEDFENRIMVSLTAQLVLAALFTSTTQSSVKTPYLKLIDVWYAAIITFCFVIVIIQTVINVIFNSVNLPSLVVRAVGVVPLDHGSDKVVRAFSSGERQQQTQVSEEVARRYNTASGVFILLVVLTFVVFYSMMAMRVL
nr:uncharacterized protein LOC128685758 [Cherax quadricarinatus]